MHIARGGIALVMTGALAVVALVGIGKARCDSRIVDPHWERMIADAMPELSDTWISGTSRLLITAYKETPEGFGGFGDPWLVLVDPWPQETLGAIRILELDDYYLSPEVNGSQISHDESTIEQICGPGGRLSQLWAAVAIANQDGVVNTDHERLFDCIGRAYSRFDFKWPFMSMEALGIYAELGITDHPSMVAYVKRARDYIEAASSDGDYLMSAQLINALRRVGQDHQYDHILSNVTALIETGDPSRVSPGLALAWLDLADAKEVACELGCRQALYRAVQKARDRFSMLGLCQSAQGCRFVETADVIEALTRLDKPNEIASVKTALWRFMGIGGWVVPNWTSQIDLDSTVAGVLLTDAFDIRNVYDATRVKRFLIEHLSRGSMSCDQIYLSLVALSHLSPGGTERDLSLLDPTIKQLAHNAFLDSANAGFSGTCALYATSVGNQQDIETARRLMDAQRPMDAMGPYGLMGMSIGNLVLRRKVPRVEETLSRYYQDGGYLSEVGIQSRTPWLDSTFAAVFYDAAAFGNELHHFDEIDARARNYMYTRGGFSRLDPTTGASTWPNLYDSLEGLAYIGLLERVDRCRHLPSYLTTF